MAFTGPRQACLVLDKMADEIGDPIIKALENTRSLTEAEMIFLKAVVEDTLTKVFLGDDMQEVRSYIHRPTRV